ncbi:hypothetical protein FSARC_4612 [Fusarium sarcochroum]|uniref:RING-type domain-containing protein n=1 Tax=Fusarium sarcochroum TaxID=1208366 RepID=A0A8H4U1D5_9HYPO|nr:hypothetical protein FSARC_4612 [Fusarium sarcochroum]
MEVMRRYSQPFLRAPPASFSPPSNNLSTQTSTLDYEQTTEILHKTSAAKRLLLTPGPGCIQQLAHRLSRCSLFTRMEEHEQDSDEKAQPLQDTCIQDVTAVYPDICLEYLKSVATPLSFVAQDVVNHIMDLQESGQSYTKRPKQSIGKRKREDDDQDDDSEEVMQAKRKYNYPGRPALNKRDTEVNTAKNMIAGEFPLVPIRAIQQQLSQHGNHLLPTFIALDNIISQTDDVNLLPWKYKKTPSVRLPQYRQESIEMEISVCRDPTEKVLMQELQAARLIQHVTAEKIWAEKEARAAELHNFEMAKARGEVTECECCFTEAPLNRLVRCNGNDTHFFCVECARRTAENQIGQSKYDLKCMSTDECTGSFSHSERQKFLDKRLTSALDRIEQEDVLRMAGLENLAECPFCHYAEEYPPVEVNREFRCQDPECAITSCRLCNFETHIPKTCEEAALARGVDMRRDVEEAMSKALIRNCNKCGTPFIKESGCNKMTCTRKGCRNVQCYVCSKSCDYQHFNDVHRGGKKGNCPLFESVEERHENEVKEAEKAAKKKVLEENPDLEADLLDFNMSDDVKKDDLRRRKNDLWVGAPRNPRPPNAGRGQGEINIFRRYVQNMGMPYEDANFPIIPRWGLPQQDINQQQKEPAQGQENGVMQPNIPAGENPQQGPEGAGLHALNHQEQQQIEGQMHAFYQQAQQHAQQAQQARQQAQQAQQAQQQPLNVEEVNQQPMEQNQNQNQHRPHHGLRARVRNVFARFHPGRAQAQQVQQVQQGQPEALPVGQFMLNPEWMAQEQALGLMNLQNQIHLPPWYQGQYQFFQPFDAQPGMQEQ